MIELAGKVADQVLEDQLEVEILILQFHNKTMAQVKHKIKRVTLEVNHLMRKVTLHIKHQITKSLVSKTSLQQLKLHISRQDTVALVLLLVNNLDHHIFNSKIIKTSNQIITAIKIKISLHLYPVLRRITSSISQITFKATSNS